MESVRERIKLRFRLGTTEGSGCTAYSLRVLNGLLTIVWRRDAQANMGREQAWEAGILPLNYSRLPYFSSTYLFSKHLGRSTKRVYCVHHDRFNISHCTSTR
jgi:hypothetical protein